jgi:uncharacterized protein
MSDNGTDIKARLQNAMKASMKAGDKKKLGVIRLMLAAIKQQEIDGRAVLDDDAIVVVLDKMVKQRRDSAKQYRDAGRDDLADTEEYEIVVIQEYMPQPLSPDEIQQLIKAAVAESGAESVKDMGKVMGLLRPKMLGRADMAVVGQEVKKFLGSN